MKVGYVSIVGKPNVGKSTLMNAIFNKKVSIVSSKSQTTRNTIDRIYEDENCQIIFVDTPGIHKPMKKLGEVMNKSSYDTIRGADVSLFLLDAGSKFTEQDYYLFNHLKFDNKVIVVFNKIDTTNILIIESLKKEVKTLIPDADIFEICAKDKFNVKELVEKICEYLPEGNKIDYNEPENYEFTISEVIRERALNILKEEVPHSLYIKVNSVEFHGKMIDSSAVIYVEKESQKGIVIGKNGEMIKRIGHASRTELEKIYHTHVNLNLVVRVRKDWRNDMKAISNYGFINK